MKKLLIYLLSGNLLLPVYGQTESREDSPGILPRLSWSRTVNYHKTDYHADIQNWSIAQGSDGVMYFANNDGLLAFDGTEWELFPHPDNLIIRSVAAGPGNRIYSGSYEDFGYWERDAFGVMIYHSLKSLVRDFDFHNQEIWKILVSGDSVWFQSFPVIFLYHGDRIEVIPVRGVITCFTKVNGQLLVRTTGRGLFRIRDHQAELLDDSPFFRNTMIRVILPCGPDKLLVATSDEGIYQYSLPDGKLQPWIRSGKDVTLGQVINRGIITPGGGYVLGSQISGIFLFDQEGRYILNFNQENGLQNNTVLSLFTDKQGQLWAGLDNGIDLVDLHSRITFFKDIKGKIGAVYSVLLYNDILFAGTNKGLFYSRIENQSDPSVLSLDFKLIPGSESQVWSLEQFGDQVFCGHNSGTYEVQDLVFRQVSNISGGYSIRRMHRNIDQYLIQGTYTDLVLYGKQGNIWDFSHRITGFNQPVQYIESDHLGYVWAGHNTKGLFRVELDDDLNRARDVTYFGQANGFESDFQIGVYRVNNRVVFLNEGNFYTYDDLNDTILLYDRLNKSLISEDKIHRMVRSGGNEYWFISDQDLMLYRITDEEVVKINSYPFELFNSHQIKDYEYIRRINSTQSILCLDNGFALIDHNDTSRRAMDQKPFFKKIQARGGRSTSNFETSPSADRPLVRLNNNMNNLEFEFAYPHYGTSVEFMIRLQGLDEDWITTRARVYRYDRLPAGTYILNLKAVDSWGNQTDELTWSFMVRPPWYWSVYSQLAYVLSFFLLLYLVRLYFLKRLSSQETRLKEEKESEIIRIRNEQLRSEISFKSKELANVTFNIIKKNELLTEIRVALEKEMKNADPDHKRSLSKITRLVEKNISNEEDWKVFESNFEKAHEEFLARIKSNYDQLTPGDLKLCAYLRMNLSTKKIAILLGISVRGVENHRYRLRKKLGLKKDQNLTEFLMTY